MKPITGILSLCLLCLPAAATHGEPTSASPMPSSSGSAAASGAPAREKAPPADPGNLDLGGIDWPKTASVAPTTEEWANVPKLAHVKGDSFGASGSCDTFVLREWVRVVCTDLTIEQDHASAIGAVWGVAGMLDDVKARVTLVGNQALATLMPDGVPTVKNMASSVDITFPLRPGHATMIEVVGASWAFEEYNGNFFSGIDPGLLIDVSWALGEKAPTLIFSGAHH